MDKRIIVGILIALPIMFLLGMFLFGRLSKNSSTLTEQPTSQPVTIGLRTVIVDGTEIAIEPNYRQLILENESQPLYAISVSAASTPFEIPATPQPGQQIVEVTREVIVEVTRFIDVTRIVDVTTTPPSSDEFMIPQVTPTAVPNPEPNRSANVTTTKYVVQPGDTLLTVAERFGITFDLMLEYNGYRDLIYPGDTIVLPLVGGTIDGTQSTPAPSDGGVCGIMHIVIPGNTVYSLSSKYGVTIESIRQTNRLGFDYSIYPNQILCIPR